MKTFKKTLYKSEENKVISGVVGGIGEYFDVDPVLLRVLYILVTVFTAFVPGVVAYILMSIVIPSNNARVHHKETKPKDEPKESEETEEKV